MNINTDNAIASLKSVAVEQNSRHPNVIADAKKNELSKFVSNEDSVFEIKSLSDEALEALKNPLRVEVPPSLKTLIAKLQEGGESMTGNMINMER